jgi:hypothetical protein
LPSDFHGVLYTPIDANGAWKMGLAREPKAAGLQVDMNKAIWEALVSKNSRRFLLPPGQGGANRSTIPV